MTRIHPAHPLIRALGVLAFALASWPCASWANSAQEKLATAYLKATASGDPAAVQGMFHPDELVQLRARVLKALEAEDAQGGSAIRSRLFGAAMSIEDVRRLTHDTFFATLSRSFGMPAEQIKDIKILGVIEENSQLAHAVARVVPPEGAPTRPRIAVVSLIRYGKDWRVQLPTLLQARVDAALVALGESTAASDPTARKVEASPELMSALKSGSETLRRGDCAEFFNEHMSPNFRSMTSTKALATLIKQCQAREDTRETYIAALDIAQRLSPRYEQDGARAVYDMRGQGLPFQRFVLEKVENRWYVAE
ncbi:MAG TPA: hypothetical protein VJ764_03055 [Steroidobacteraceae bacterium]|nr:hypothetical protein [Steroidobacteraceae bacterium]